MCRVIARSDVMCVACVKEESSGSVNGRDASTPSKGYRDEPSHSTLNTRCEVRERDTCYCGLPHNSESDGLMKVSTVLGTGFLVLVLDFVCGFIPATCENAVQYRQYPKLPTRTMTPFDTTLAVNVKETSLKKETALFASSREPNSVDGTGRGLILFGGVLAVCVWLFSIPPEFRRAHFCAVEQCVQNRSKCYDCVTFSEWTTGVGEYYKNGGGVHFDFTVAEETKALWKDAISK